MTTDGFAMALKKLVNRHFAEMDHQTMADNLSTASEMVVAAHADPAAQGHSYRVFPEEDDPDFGNPFGGQTDDGA